MRTGPDSSDGQVATFLVRDLLLGLPIDHVSEVVRTAAMVPVPLSPGAVTGMFNLRGRVVTVVDARARLGLPPAADLDPGVHLIVSVGEDRVSLVVDRTSDVVTVSGSDREDVPETLPAHLRELLTDAYQRPEGLLLLLDPTAVTTAA